MMLRDAILKLRHKNWTWSSKALFLARVASIFNESDNETAYKLIYLPSQVFK